MSCQFSFPGFISTFFDPILIFLTKMNCFWLFWYFVGNSLGLGFTQSQSSACLLLSASFICAVHTPSSRLFLQQYPSALWHLKYTVRTRFPIFTWGWGHVGPEQVRNAHTRTGSSLDQVVRCRIRKISNSGTASEQARDSDSSRTKSDQVHSA